MNNKKFRLRAVTIALIAAIIALRCVNSGQLAGTITQSGNGFICGKVVDTSGAPGGARVVLLPEIYDPVKDTGHIAADIADASGNFAFENISPGNYVIVAVHAGSGKRTVIRDVHVYKDRTDSLAADTLRAPGSIKVMAPSSADVTNGYLYIAGTPTFTFLKNSTGFAVLDSVAAGKPVTISYSTTTTSAQTVLRYSVPVAPGETAEVWNTGWNYARKITLNTTATGANVTGNVTGFPALVRLTESNFVFTQARNNGEDIRFAKRDNTVLPYEIERWDAIGKKAEVWVRVDTVHGNDSAQSIMMYWGYADAAAQSNSSAVFDTANGFQGVWHLSETGSAIAKDATGNHYDGTPSDTAPAGAEGTIGPCRSFNGSSNYLRMNGTANSTLDFPDNGVYTVSAWVYVDSLDNGSHVIAGKGNEQYFLKFKIANPNIPNSPMVWEFVDYYDKTGYNITNSLPSIPQTRTWSYIVGVRKGTQQFLYLNGAFIDSTPTLSSLAAPRNTGDDVTIGKFVSAPADTTGGKCPFLGKIDEVRISNAAHNPDWIKLCYMNQKQQDALVKW